MIGSKLADVKELCYVPLTFRLKVNTETFHLQHVNVKRARTNLECINKKNPFMNDFILLSAIISSSVTFTGLKLVLGNLTLKLKVRKLRRNCAKSPSQKTSILKCSSTARPDSQVSVDQYSIKSTHFYYCTISTTLKYH